MNLGSFNAEKMEEIDPIDYIDPFKYTKRDFLIELFKEYNNLPIQKSLSNFAKVYNDVFVREIPSVMASYALLEIQITEIANMGQKDERFTIPFRFNFANMTSKHCDYIKSPHYIETLRALCRCRKMKDNMDDEQGLLDLQKRGSR